MAGTRQLWLMTLKPLNQGMSRVALGSACRCTSFIKPPIRLASGGFVGTLARRVSFVASTDRAQMQALLASLVCDLPLTLVEAESKHRGYPFAVAATVAH